MATREATLGIVSILALALLSACSRAPVHVDLATLPGPPGSSLHGDNVKLAPGTALVVDAHPREDDGDPVDTTVEIASAAPFEVSTTATRNRFVILAKGSGHATLRVVVEGEEVRTLTADAP